MKVKLLNIWLDLCSSEDILQTVASVKYFTRCNTLFFINAHCFNVAQKDDHYRNILNNTDILLNDGIGIEIAANFEKISFKENLNGTDLIPQILRIAGENSYRVYLIGGGKNVAKKAAENLKSEFPEINIVGCSHGYFSPKEEEFLINDINQKNTDIVIVGMGVPLQEKWIWKNKDKFDSVKLCIAGGAIFDFISGRIQRAPVILHKLRLEWLFRLLLEPKRLCKRYLIGNLIFFVHILKFKLFTNYQNPELEPLDAIQNILNNINNSKTAIKK